MHQTLCGRETGVQINGSDDGFQRISQYGRPFLSSRTGLALAQTNDVWQAQLDRQAMQCVLLDQIGTHAGQIAFGQCAQTLKQQVSHRQVQYRIPKELESFIVIN